MLVLGVAVVVTVAVSAVVTDAVDLAIVAVCWHCRSSRCNMAQRCLPLSSNVQPRHFPSVQNLDRTQTHHPPLPKRTKTKTGVVTRSGQYRRSSRDRRCREYFYGGGGGAAAVGGAPALSPAALHLDFNDVSIFRVGGQSVSDAMLPVGHSDSSLGPLQVGCARGSGGCRVSLSSFLFLFRACVECIFVPSISLRPPDVVVFSSHGIVVSSSLCLNQMCVFHWLG